MIDNGWVKLHRKFLKWEWYSDVNTTRVFIHLLLTANYEDKEWKGILVKRGQLVTSYRKLVKETGLSFQQIRNTLNNTQKTHEITQQSTTTYTLITINNYDEYQTTTHETTHKPTHETTTIKEYKEIKNIYTSVKYLLNIPSKDIEQITKDIGIDKLTIINKGKKLYDWCLSKGKNYKNYYRFLRNCLNSDLEKQPNSNNITNLLNKL